MLATCTLMIDASDMPTEKKYTRFRPQVHIDVSHFEEGDKVECTNDVRLWEKINKRFVTFRQGETYKREEKFPSNAVTLFEVDDGRKRVEPLKRRNCVYLPQNHFRILTGVTNRRRRLAAVLNSVDQET